jgi:2-keto-3-deoxy-L-rhamnonate aldolase RhmA
MNENRYRKRAGQGEVQIGTWVNMVRTPGILTLLKAAGLDFVRVDMEHSPFSMETIADMAALSRALDFPMVVRPPEGNREWVTRLLDSGVWNLHVPQVDTPEQAYEVAKHARYAPAGMRGMSASGPHTEYESSPPAKHTATMNSNVHITVMLESKQAFDHLEEIASVPGIDALTLGPSDLAQELGVLGKPEQQKVTNEYRARLAEAARRHGKQVAMLADSVDGVRRMIELGATIITYSSEVAVLKAGYTSALVEIQKGLAGR